MDYPIYYEGRRVGGVQLLEQGSRTQVEVHCRLDRTGLYRAYLMCRDGEYPLGVLEPYGEEACLKRTVLTGDLNRIGPVERGEARMSYAFSGSRDIWNALGKGEHFFRRDRELSTLLTAGCPGARWRQAGERRYLALPYDPGQPFPIPRLFCFARIQSIEGRSYVVYAFDREEHPVMEGNFHAFPQKWRRKHKLCLPIL